MAFLEVKDGERFVIYQKGDVVIEYQTPHETVQKFLNFKDFCAKETAIVKFFKIGEKRLNKIFITRDGKLVFNKFRSEELFDVLEEINLHKNNKHLPFKYNGNVYYAVDYWPLINTVGNDEECDYKNKKKWDDDFVFTCKRCGLKRLAPLFILSEVVDWEYRKPVNHDEMVFDINHSIEGRMVLKTMSDDGSCSSCCG